MFRKIILSVFILSAFLCCQDDNPTEPYNYERDTPGWLKIKIDSMVTNDINSNSVGTEVYRYTWNNEYVYDIDIPTSMCRYCLLFDKNGNRIIFKNSQETNDFFNNIKNKIIIWVWED